MTDRQFERFIAKVDRSNPDGCWPWRGAVSKAGYGYFGLAKKMMRLAHRASYEHSVGPIPQDLEIDHRCKNRACVNPSHLEAVTRQENIRRSSSPEVLRDANDRRKAATHCVHGHLYTAENTYVRIRARGGIKRACKRCKALRAHLMHLAKKAVA